MEKISRILILLTGLFFSLFAFADNPPPCPAVNQLDRVEFFKNTDFTQGSHYSAEAWSKHQLVNGYEELTIYFNPKSGSNPLMQANNILSHLNSGDVQGPYSNSWGPYHWHFCVYGGVGNPDHFVLVHTAPVMMK